MVTATTRIDNGSRRAGRLWAPLLLLGGDQARAGCGVVGRWAGHVRGGGGDEETVARDGDGPAGRQWRF